MAKTKKKIRRRAKTTISLAVAAPIATELGMNVWPRIKDGNVAGATNQILRDYTGFDAYQKNFGFERMKAGALPLLVGTIVHKMAGRFGINRAIANAGIPWIRI